MWEGSPDHESFYKYDQLPEAEDYTYTSFQEVMSVFFQDIVCCKNISPICINSNISPIKRLITYKTLQVGAVTECHSPYFIQAIRDCNRAEGSAVEECTAANSSQAIIKPNGGERSAAHECFIFNYNQAVREVDGGEGSTVLECLVVDVSKSFWNSEFLQCFSI